MNTIKTDMVFLNTLNAGERFVLRGESTVYVCESRRNGGGMTTIVYRVEGADFGPWTFTKPGMTTIYLVSE